MINELISFLGGHLPRGQQGGPGHLPEERPRLHHRLLQALREAVLPESPGAHGGPHHDGGA